MTQESTVVEEPLLLGELGQFNLVRLGAKYLGVPQELGAVDLADESEATRQLYGIGAGPGNSFGRCCLLARRLVERGVRFVQLYHGNWDTHGDNEQKVQQLAGQIDRPIAGLLIDLNRVI